MKLRTMLAVLALTVAAWAQTATQGNNPAPSQGNSATSSDTKAECPCCHEGADGKAAMAGCTHHAKADASQKEPMSCCDGKGTMACMKDKQPESATTTSAGKKCGMGEQKDGCAKSGKDGEKAAMTCCGGAGHCGMDHQHDHGDTTN